MSKRINATARVQITVEVQESSWGGDCAIDQLYKQASEQAVARLRNTLNKAGCECRFVGDAKVLGVITEQEK